MRPQRARLLRIVVAVELTLAFVLLAGAALVHPIGKALSVPGQRAQPPVTAALQPTPEASPVAAQPSPAPVATPSAVDAAPSPPPVAAVAGNLPARLLIPAISVSTRIEHVGLATDGSMQTPYNIYNAAWFSPGVKPGETGDAVIDGHVGLPGQPLVFAHLNRLRLGDAITVVSGDGHAAHFIVSSSRVVPAGASPAGLFSRAGPPTLSLITCTGQYDGGSYSYSDRLIVDARFAGTD